MRSLLALLLLIPPTPAPVLHVDPERGPYRTIAAALADAKPGDSIVLHPGTYSEDLAIITPGITIKGPRTAIVNGAGTSSRVIQVHADNVTLSGFTIDGKVCSSLVEACYRDKGIYVVSLVAGDGVSGTRIVGMKLTNLGGECVRMKYHASSGLVAYNEIGPCGVHDFGVPNSTTGQNGEGVYIGTAPEQTHLNPSPEPDASNHNLVLYNVFDTLGAECVDIKEGSSFNEVAFNSCTGQLPRNGNSGAMESRGSYNSFHHNRIFANAAAGVRLGGDLPGDAVGKLRVRERDCRQFARRHQGSGRWPARARVRQPDVRQRGRQRRRHLQNHHPRPHAPLPFVTVRRLDRDLRLRGSRSRRVRGVI